VGHKLTSLFLIDYIYFSQIYFIVIFQNVRLRLSNSSNLAYSGNIFTNKCTRAALAHSSRLITILVCAKIGVKLLILYPMRIDFIIDLIVFNSKSAHSKTVALRRQILTLVRLIVSTFC
jgi:membrane carboxypeptidase/penicillin-binding protein